MCALRVTAAGVRRTDGRNGSLSGRRPGIGCSTCAAARSKAPTVGLVPHMTSMKQLTGSRVGPYNQSMALLRRRRPLRAALALVTVLGWTVGPWTPIALCAIDAATPAVDVAPKPSCHEAAPQDPAPERASHRCCHDVATSCCLSATAISGTVTGISKLDPPDTAAMLVLPTSTSMEIPVVSSLPFVRGRPPAAWRATTHTILRL